MRIKVRGIVAGILLFFLCGFGVPASAQGLSEDYAEYFESSGANELFGMAPEETQDLLEESGIASLDSEELLALDAGSLWDALLGELADRLAQPVKILVLTLGMVLIASMMGIMQSTTGEGTQSVFSVVVVLGVSGIIVSPLVQVIQDITRRSGKSLQALYRFTREWWRLPASHCQHLPIRVCWSR